ncbi:methionine ABC transporter permease [Caproiciproducens sp. MSJ-32]|uniref:methionine ABC transporter permease n=1 Tax=Caproiciproducens sp. MSJ-32 TaxID=2841527 RepID=UPI001C1147A2|nr:methionine ABC transporter permease [Caproiciproducens sp. MSJ-32]MBU5455318.1 ABC transporter permease [Caproiciproducens sp. MSJ-32]
MTEILLPAIYDTIVMVFFSTLFAVIIGSILGIILVLTSPKGLKENRTVYQILDAIINILRSFPFIILIVVIIPLTRTIVGRSTGTAAAIVPLTIAAAPFVARIIEASLKEVDEGVIEAAKSFGASNTQIVFKVMIKEAVPSIISGLTLTVINIIGYSAMAGSVGAGGLGDVAIRYGYQRYETDIMIVTVILLIIIVQGLQSLGNNLYKKLS